MKHVTILVFCLIMITDAHAQLVIKNSSNQELSRITHSGNVGIGTTNPTDKLTVAGNTRVTGTGTLGVAGLGGSGEVWIKSDNNGVLFKSVPAPGPSVRIKAYCDNNQILAAETWDWVEFNQEMYDSHNAFSGNQFTTPVTGFYHIRIRLTVSRSAVAVYLTKNGANNQSIIVQPDFGNVSSVFVEDIVELTAGDWLRVYAYTSAGEDATLMSPGSLPQYRAPNWSSYHYFEVISLF